jgi:hypothetical protein
MPVPALRCIAQAAARPILEKILARLHDGRLAWRHG